MGQVIYHIASVISWIISAYLTVLIIRMILDWIRFFARDWTPSGPILVVANAIYALTDPPLKWLGRRIPPARLGNVALDVGFLVLFFGLIVLRGLMWRLVGAIIGA
ncbi:MAG: YggT family protein [Actinomycetaceae bacterium]|nr:YggT family protein [Actinomycetaceae bacterium]MDU0970048.1 YggT family protein [Actinomycetaceae bacterium]